MPGVFVHKTLLPLALVAITQTGVAQPPAPTLHISGADARLEENIRAHLRLLLTERCETEVRRLNRLLPQVARDVERAAQALGYYRSQQQASFTRNENCWELGISRATANRRWQYGIAVIVWRLNGRHVPSKRSMDFDFASPGSRPYVVRPICGNGVTIS